MYGTREELCVQLENMFTFDEPLTLLIWTEEGISVACRENQPEPDVAEIRAVMKTIDEMLNLDLLTHEQHGAISAWIARSASPDDILQMPAPLWQAVERASEVMGVNEDLLRVPALDAGGVMEV